jgi:hypothetical protein
MARFYLSDAMRRLGPLRHPGCDKTLWPAILWWTGSATLARYHHMDVIFLSGPLFDYGCDETLWPASPLWM